MRRRPGGRSSGRWPRGPPTDDVREHGARRGGANQVSGRRLIVAPGPHGPGFDASRRFTPRDATTDDTTDDRPVTMTDDTTDDRPWIEQFDEAVADLRHEVDRLADAVEERYG